MSKVYGDLNGRYHGTDFNYLVNTVERDDFGKEDFVVLPRIGIDLERATEKPCILVKDLFGERPYVFNDVGFTQFCNKLGMPSSYMKKCPNDLFCDNAEHWISKSSVAEDPWLLRTKRSTDPSSPGYIRAVLSDRYGTLDNKHVIQGIEKIVDKQRSFSLQNFSLTDRGFYVNGVFSDTAVDLGMSEGKPDTIFGGIHISNSEVGCGTVSISVLIFRQVCSNGLILSSGDFNLYRRKHIVFDHSDLIKNFEIAANNIYEPVRKAIDIYARSKDEKIENPVETIEDLGKKFNLTVNQIERVKDNFEIEGGDDNKFTLINAFTRTARDLENDDLKAEMESQASRILTLKLVS